MPKEQVLQGFLIVDTDDDRVIDSVVVDKQLSDGTTEQKALTLTPALREFFQAVWDA